MTKPTKKPLLFGAMMTAGSAIGAGMFSLPVVSSGMWFPLTLVSLVAIWLVSYLTALVVLEISMAFPIGKSFGTFSTELLGKSGGIVMGFSIGFLLYILLYAYFSAFGNMATHTLQLNTSTSFPTQGVLGLLLGILIAGIVWIGTVSVGRISTLLVIGMGLSFIISLSGAFGQVNSHQLISQANESDSRFPYVWAGLSYFITSFGFMTMVPSLYKYYGQDLPKIKGSLLLGSLLTLITYIVWIGITFGIITRSEFIPISAAGGNMSDLIGTLEQKIGSTTIQSTLNLFFNFAVISSFLGVGLNLFDYLADRLGFNNSKKERFYTACITFLPPGIASVFFPHGFIAAIGFAGLVTCIGFFLLPFLMVWKLRATNKPSVYRLIGGKPMLLMILAVSMLTAICHVLAMLDYLPKL